MSFLLRYNLLVVFFFMLSHSFAQVVQDEVKAKIEIQKTEDNITITGQAENLSDIIKSASYKLSVIKKDNKSNNNSNNSQEGIFTLNPSETKKLSTTQVNVGTDDEVIVLLLFYDENQQIISKDRLVLGGEKKKRT